MPVRVCILYSMFESVCIFYNADGQYMASRISRFITKQTAKLKALMNKFNAIIPANESVSWEQITDLSSSFWLGKDGIEGDVHRSVRLQAINAYSKLQCATEELRMLDEEIINVVLFHVHDYKMLMDAISSADSSTCYGSGSICLLKHRLADSEEEMKACVNAFNVYFDSIVDFICIKGYLSDGYDKILLEVCKYVDREVINLATETSQQSNPEICKIFHGNKTNFSKHASNCAIIDNTDPFEYVSDIEQEDQNHSPEHLTNDPSNRSDDYDDDNNIHESTTTQSLSDQGVYIPCVTWIGNRHT